MSESQEGRLQNYSVDQLAGAVVLVLGAIAGLLQVIWMSKCHCKVNFFWCFQCERRPPSEEEMKGLKDSIKAKKDKLEADKQDKKDLEKQNIQLIPESPKPDTPKIKTNITDLA